MRKTENSLFPKTVRKREVDRMSIKIGEKENMLQDA